MPIELTCVDCGFKGNFSVGIDFEIQLGDILCIFQTDEDCFSVTKAALNFTVLEFEQSANLEVFVGQEFRRSLNWTYVLHTYFFYR